MNYEVWDTTTRNLLGSYPTEAEAIELIRTMLEAHGEDGLRALALGSEDENGGNHMIATGDRLLELARQGAAATSPARYAEPDISGRASSRSEISGALARPISPTFRGGFIARREFTRRSAAPPVD